MVLKVSERGKRILKLIEEEELADEKKQEQNKQLGSVMICDRCGRRNTLGLYKCEGCGDVLLTHRLWPTRKIGEW